MSYAAPSRPTAARHGLVGDDVKSTPDDAWLAQLRADFPVEPAIEDVLTRKLTRRGRDTYVPVDVAALAVRTTAFLQRQIDGEIEVRGLDRLPGGASKEQFAFELEWAPDGEVRVDRMVLRMNPPASVVETSRVREFQVLKAVVGAIPVPEVFWATEDPADFGEPAIITGFVTGVAAPTAGDRQASGIGTGYGPLRDTLAPQFVDHLARLHTLEIADKDLSAFVIPEVGTTQAADVLLTQWFRAWAEDSLEEHPTIALARTWLWAHRPALDRVSLLHGDYRNGNFLFDEATATITSVLDWELAGVGDRHMDLAYLLLPMWGHDDEDGRFVFAGLQDREGLIADYEAKSGLTVDPERLRFYQVLNLFWVATACYASGLRAARSDMTHLDVMMGFVSGLGAASVHDMNRLMQEG